MGVKNSEIVDLLVEELENKKVFDVGWEIECGLCGGSLMEGDRFIFVGDKNKICMDCRGEMVDYLQGI